MKFKNESDFKSSVIDLAKHTGWKWYHNPDSRRSSAGFPDLVLVKPPNVLFVELKMDNPGSKLTADQLDWQKKLNDCTDVKACVITPDSYEFLTITLCQR